LSTTPRLAALITAIALAGATAGEAAPARGASFTVNATHDAPDAAPFDGVCADASGACTLRAAVMEANGNGPNVVVVPAGTYQLSWMTDEQSGTPQVAGLWFSASMTLRGAGPTATVIDGGGQAVVLTIGVAAAVGIAVDVEDLTIQNGFGGGGAGAIEVVNPSKITLRRVVLAGNSGSAGAMAVRDHADVFDSLIAGNSGGGVLVRGNLVMNNSTVSGNGGAGIRLESGNASLTNVTVALNSGDGTFGVQAKNSIFAHNGAPDCIVSHGHNLVTDTCGPLTGPGDIGGVQPQLTGLQDNGGPTLTHGLYPNSPAIDAGDNAACPAADQRGVSRPHGAACDIGAYEYVTPPTRPPTEPPPPPPPPPPPTAAPTASPVLRVQGSPSPSPAPLVIPTATATQRRERRPTFTPTLIDVETVEEEVTGGGVSPVASGLLAAGVLGLIGSAAGGGYYWRRRRLRRGRRE
jgi:CSLREA domain-containing protein